MGKILRRRAFAQRCKRVGLQQGPKGEDMLAHFGVPQGYFVSPTNFAMGNCSEYDHLHAEVENVLANLAQVTTLLLELFRSKDLSGVHRLDKELELTVGEKERCIGALRQHIKEHNCVTPL